MAAPRQAQARPQRSRCCHRKRLVLHRSRLPPCHNTRQARFERSRPRSCLHLYRPRQAKLAMPLVMRLSSERLLALGARLHRRVWFCASARGNGIEDDPSHDDLSLKLVRPAVPLTRKAIFCARQYAITTTSLNSRLMTSVRWSGRKSMTSTASVLSSRAILPSRSPPLPDSSSRHAPPLLVQQMELPVSPRTSWPLECVSA